ncbi:F-box protein [Tripterygium wilfordii]|uniref:F-box protein n=2 Tax=Tripterygium wilfordii TaxID=458696 RepID=A0A7J7CG41_TRIWF|nr:F-box protein [Tripterygium wilfordii]
MSMKILMCLEDVSDLARICAVSCSWRHFVVENGLCKSFCVRLFPQLSRVGYVIENCCEKKLVEFECSSSRHVEREFLEKEHKVYMFLARGVTSFAIRKCISDAISASSTDNFPAESINNTLDSRDRIGRRASYWSSKGQKNPAVPERLTYKLVSNICVINEISIHPFEAYFQFGHPIYSAKSVRFRMGHSKIPIDDHMGDTHWDLVDDQLVWTYTSQEFPVAQENRLQTFVLPQPVLCIGGIFQIELLGRVQKQEMDGLFYICVSHVQVMGRSLSPAFDVEILKPSGEFALKVLSYTQPNPPEDSPVTTASSEYLLRRVRDLAQIVNMLQGDVGVHEDYEWEEEDVEADDEFPL